MLKTIPVDYFPVYGRSIDDFLEVIFNQLDVDYSFFLWAIIIR